MGKILLHAYLKFLSIASIFVSGWTQTKKVKDKVKAH